MEPDQLPDALYCADQVRELDRRAIQEHGIPGIVLMKRAGEAAFRYLFSLWPDTRELIIYCGTGNNGGDGYIVAALAARRGIKVRVVQLGETAKVSGDALLARQLAVQEQVCFEPFAVQQERSLEAETDNPLIVDALLGTGLTGKVRPDYLAAIRHINNSPLPVLALDIPSGLCSDTGAVLGDAVRADATISFIGLKQGLLTGDGPACCGALQFADLGVPPQIFTGMAASSVRLDLAATARLLPRRRRTAHKGQFGHVMVIGGDFGMAGAASMAAQAASRVGAGLVSVATRPEHVSAIVARCPEIMAHGVVSGQEIEPLLERPSVIVIGPGLGQGAWGEQLLQKAVATELPMVVDADALNILARGRVVTNPHRSNWLLTPHPGEAARLLGVQSDEIRQNRFTAVRALKTRYGGAVILKGAGSLVCDQVTGGAAQNTAMATTTQGIGICPYGNPGMATGGMGDVLSGLLGGLLAQGLSLGDAARLGVCLHGRSADLAAEECGERGLMATDLIPWLRQLVNPGE